MKVIKSKLWFAAFYQEWIMIPCIYFVIININRWAKIQRYIGILWVSLAGLSKLWSISAKFLANMFLLTCTVEKQGSHSSWKQWTLLGSFPIWSMEISNYLKAMQCFSIFVKLTNPFLDPFMVRHHNKGEKFMNTYRGTKAICDRNSLKSCRWWLPPFRLENRFIKINSMTLKQGWRRQLKTFKIC